MPCPCHIITRKDANVMDFSKLTSFLDEFPKKGLPEVDLAVTYKGKEVYRHLVGYSDAAKTKPASENDLYWIYSTSKVITCTAAMRLVEEGRISLDDPVSKYLPAFKDITVKQPDGSVVPAKNEMKILHLFLMGGGLDYDKETPAIKALLAEKPDASTAEICNAMAYKPLRFEPGTRYLYSLCHDVLGGIIEVVSGEKFGDYLKKNIFDPLGMNDTGFHPTDEQLSRIVDIYRFNRADGTATVQPPQDPFKINEVYESGGGGIFSKTSDYIKFVTCLANGGKTADGFSILKPETIEMLKVPRLCPAAKADMVNTRLHGYSWGLCGRVHENPVYSMSKSPVGEFGWDSAGAAFTMVDTDNRVALFLACHVLGCNYAYHVLHPWMRNLVYEGLGL